MHAEGTHDADLFAEVERSMPAILKLLSRSFLMIPIIGGRGRTKLTVSGGYEEMESIG